MFAVLADGWSYADWVVGTKEIRAVDKSWPAVGARIRYAVGAGPLTFTDVTEVRAVETDRSLVLEARGWPAGTVGIRLRLEETTAGTRIAMGEEPERGPARWLHSRLTEFMVFQRNRVTLRRLRRLVHDQADRA